MAKDQGLSLNPTKISGTCGRLMCCLKYENDAYQDLLKQTPPNESLVDTPYGRGTVMDTSLLRGTCRVRMMNSSDAPVTVPCDQCTVLRRGRDKGEPLDLPAPPVPQPLPKDESIPAELDAPKAEQGESKPRRDRERRRPDNRENRGERPQNHKPAERRDKPKSDKPENKPRPQQEKPKAQNDKPKKDKPQQEPKPAEGAQAPKEGGDYKRRNHRGGRRNHRGGGNKPQGGKPQAPKAE